jgi:DNA-binding transcriptional ArsR family regulator
MAKENTARNRAAESPRPRSMNATKNNTASFDNLIHERTRLAIVSTLAVNESLTFQDLKASLDLTDGNLSVHAQKLEEAGYVHCTKTFSGRKPKTEFRLSAKGRAALVKYLNHMERLIQAVRKE